MSLPILYSFRRCPYAIRARMALALSECQFELREVLLRDKPDCLFEYCSAGTVPVLVLSDGTVLDQSIDIIRWAIQQTACRQDYGGIEFDSDLSKQLIAFNDGEFKFFLDRYKYFDRFPEHPQEYYLDKCQPFLQRLEGLLKASRFLTSDNPSYTDFAVFPFIRQFAFVDKSKFDDLPYPNTQAWLSSLLASDLFTSVMTKYAVWKPGDEELVFP